jgi:thiol-disulfide isomerase/thioredoxin
LGDSVTDKEYLLELKHQLIIEDSVLNEFSKKYNPNEEFMHWAKKNNKYSIAGHLLYYYWYFDVNRNQRKPEIYDTKIFPVNDDAAIVTGYYLEYLNNYLNIKYFSNPHIADVFEREGASAASNVIFDNIIANENPCLSRDIMLYNTLLDLMESPFPGQDSVFQNYAPYLSSEVLINILNEKRAAFENREETNKTTLNLGLNSNSEIIRNFWETISSKHKDKIIYLDIWATWCGPCLAEIPSAIDLHSHFENKPVAFVNLCLASERDDWKKILTKHHIKGDNYFFNEDETKLLEDELNIRGYPAYMIIDGNGDIINKNAPRPSSGNEIKDLLNKLL